MSETADNIVVEAIIVRGHAYHLSSSHGNRFTKRE